MKPTNEAEKNLISLLRDVGDMELNLSEIVDLVIEFAYPDPTNNWNVNSACATCPPPPARPEFVDQVMEKIIKRKIALFWVENNRIKEFDFALEYPIISWNMGPMIKGFDGIAQSSQRIATQGVGENALELYFNNDRSILEGTEVNAFRHALWQAVTTHMYGFDLAEKIGNAHEKKPWAHITNEEILKDEGPPFTGIQYLDHQATAAAISRSMRGGGDERREYGDSWVEKGRAEVFYDVLDADEVIDLFNNEIGRNIGKNFSDDDRSIHSMKKIAFSVLDEFYETGLYLMIIRDDGYYGIEKVKLQEEKFLYMKNVLEHLDHIGKCRVDISDEDKKKYCVKGS